MTESGRNDRPFLILTLQRTGGTNLTFQLTRRSSWKLTNPHEPFNRPRVFGNVTRAWERDRNTVALDAAMAQICAKQENVKHCVELVPVKITEALIDAAVSADYRFLFLYREDPVARILSVEYANRTKIWGPSHVRKVADDAAAFETPLDVETLLEREIDCIARLNSAWEQLVAWGASPVALSYEELYGRDQDHAWVGLRRVLSRLDLSWGEVKDRKIFATMRVKGNQNTRERYARFSRLNELRQGSEILPRFVFDESRHAPIPLLANPSRSDNPGPDDMTALETPTTPVNTEIRGFISDITPIFRGRQVFIADVGAHVGATFAAFYQSSLRVNRACLFEANPKNFADLEKHVAELSAEKRATCLQVAVSDKPGTLYLHDMNDMSRVIGSDPEKAEIFDGRTFEVDAKPLDDFRTLFPDGHISILKVDVEGHELSVLRGAAGLLADHAVEVIYVEAGFDKDNPQQTHYREIEDLLLEHGYRLFKIYEQTMEWVDDRPLLRRVNMAFISPDVATRYPYSILKELTQLDARIGEKAKEINTLRHDMTRKDTEAQTQSRAFDKLRKESDAKTVEIEDLHKEQAKTKAELEENGGKLSKSHQELAILSREVHDLDLKAAGDKERKAKLVQTQTQLEAALAKLDKTEAKLDKTEAKLAERQKRVRDLETSTSWKVTAPIRGLSRRLKGK